MGNKTSTEIEKKMDYKSPGSCLAGFSPLNYFHAASLAGIDPKGIGWESPGILSMIITIFNFHLR